MESIYEQKQRWLRNVMASKHSPAEKVFAFSIFSRAYGDKTTSYPSTKDIFNDTNLATSKYPDYRRALRESGALFMEKSRQGKYNQENYTYELNLEWESHVPTRYTGSESHVPSGDTAIDTHVPRGDTATESHVPTRYNPCTQKVVPMYPEGSTHVPRGVSNISSNTSNKSSRKKTTDESAVASSSDPFPNFEIREVAKVVRLKRNHRLRGGMRGAPIEYPNYNFQPLPNSQVVRLHSLPNLENIETVSLPNLKTQDREETTTVLPPHLAEKYGQNFKPLESLDDDEAAKRRAAVRKLKQERIEREMEYGWTS